MSAASSSSVLVKCSARYGARSGDWLCAVSPSFTSNAPRIASTSVNATEATLAARARCPRTVALKVHASNADNREKRNPAGDAMRELDDACRSSAECCITVPLQSGQWLPHPRPSPSRAPAAPHRITAMK